MTKERTYTLSEIKAAINRHYSRMQTMNLDDLPFESYEELIFKEGMNYSIRQLDIIIAFELNRYE